jgi:hypothetical protein
LAGLLASFGCGCLDPFAHFRGLPLADLMGRIRQAEAQTPDVRDVRLYTEGCSGVGERPHKEMQRTKPAQPMEFRR